MGWWSRGQLWGIRILKKGKLQTVNENGLSWTVDLDGVAFLWNEWMLDCGFDGVFEEQKRAIIRWL